jgi:predicted Zn-dependent protease
MMPSAAWRVRVCVAATSLAAAAACTINPVTGERQLALISPADEIAIGTSQYAPSRQMQGGDYVLDRELTRYVSDVGNRLANVSDRNLPYEFSIINSSVPNAWALPGGKIAVNRGLLLELDSEAELAAVLGHEIVHAAARHGALAMQRDLLLQGAVLAASVATRRGDYSGVAVGAASVGAQLINQRNSREAELESDEYGMLYMSRAGYDPAAAVDLQETFVRLSGSRDAGRLAGLFASHPPSTERVARNRETSARLPMGGEIGRERYLTATQRLRESRPAYVAYDGARDAYADGRYDEARSLANEAVNRLPAEGHFHALLGDIASAEEQWADAAGHYRDAIARNGGFFHYRLKLGLALQAMNDLDNAEAQLEASIDLLPTADAYNGLGEIAERRGDPASALEHYHLAAESSSAAGRAASVSVVRLELPDDPGRFLESRATQDAQGRLVIEVANPTAIGVEEVTVRIRYLDDNGRAMAVIRELTGALPAGSERQFATGLGPFANDSSYEVIFISASVVEQ